MSNAILLKCPFVNLSVSKEFPVLVVTEVRGTRVLSHGNHSWKKPPLETAKLTRTDMG